MGAEYCFAELSATSEESAIEEVRALIENTRYERGHGGYTGTLAEAQGVEVNHDLVPGSVDDAYSVLNDSCEKWGPAVIVKTISGVYCVGAVCSS